MKYKNFKSLCYYIAQCEYSSRIFKKEKRNIITANDFSATDFDNIKSIAEKLITAMANAHNKIETIKDFDKLIKTLCGITRHFDYNSKIKKEIFNILEIKIRGDKNDKKTRI